VAFGRGAHDEVIEELNLHSGGGQARRVVKRFSFVRVRTEYISSRHSLDAAAVLQTAKWFADEICNICSILYI
jgi:hypothetical protein